MCFKGLQILELKTEAHEVWKLHMGGATNKLAESSTCMNKFTDLKKNETYFAKKKRRRVYKREPGQSGAVLIVSGSIGLHANLNQLADRDPNM